MRRPHTLPARSGLLAALVLSLVVCSCLIAMAPASAKRWPGHPNRNVVTHVVRSGDTATELAVRYHAWTAELLAINGLRESSYLVVGQRIKIPVVTDRVRSRPAKPRADKPRRPRVSTSALVPMSAARDRRLRARGWSHFRHDRAFTRKLIVREARKHDVPRNLALAVAWQESGWHQPLVSSAGAIGVMQVLPSTGAWMSWYADRVLDLRNAHDNITAGVVLLRVLDRNTSTTRRQVAAYYQGLAGVKEHGLYDETKQYVRSVLAIRARLREGWRP